MASLGGKFETVAVGSGKRAFRASTRCRRVLSFTLVQYLETARYILSMRIRQGSRVPERGGGTHPQ